MKQQCGGGCLGAPMRALSRACDSACDLYVRGMSGCARRMPSGAAAAVDRGGFGRSASASSMFLHASSDSVEDLVRAATTARQSRRVVPAEAVVDGAGKKTMGDTAQAVKIPARKTGVAAMGTIAEDVPCEFGADGACVLKPPASRRRGAAAGGLATRPGGFGGIKAGSEVFAR